MSDGEGVLRAIGNTSMVQLHRVVPPGCAKVFVKAVTVAGLILF